MIPCSSPLNCWSRSAWHGWRVSWPQSCWVLPCPTGSPPHRSQLPGLRWSSYRDGMLLTPTLPVLMSWEVPKILTLRRQTCSEVNQLRDCHALSSLVWRMLRLVFKRTSIGEIWQRTSVLADCRNIPQATS